MFIHVFNILFKTNFSNFFQANWMIPLVIIPHLMKFLIKISSFSIKEIETETEMKKIVIEKGKHAFTSEMKKRLYFVLNIFVLCIQIDLPVRFSSAWLSLSLSLFFYIVCVCGLGFSRIDGNVFGFKSVSGWIFVFVCRLLICWIFLK